MCVFMVLIHNATVKLCDEVVLLLSEAAVLLVVSMVLLFSVVAELKDRGLPV